MSLKLWQNSRTQIGRKLKNSNLDKTQQHKLWQKLKSHIVTKLKNSNCGKTQQFKLWQYSKHKLWQNSKTQIVTKLKNTNCDKTQNFKLWPNLKTQIVTKLWQCDSSGSSVSSKSSDIFLNLILDPVQDNASFSNNKIKNKKNDMAKIRISEFSPKNNFVP